MINTIHTVSGILLLITLITKIGLHIYLDKRIGISKSFYMFISAPFLFLNPYKKDVPERYSTIKIYTNISLLIFILSLIINIILGLLTF